MIKNKKVVFIFVLFLLSILSIFWILSKSGVKFAQKPTPTPYEEFKLIKSIPENNSSNPLLDTSSIEFYFSKPIDVSSLVINVEPQTDIVIDTDDNNKALFVHVVGGWQYETLYKMSVEVKSSTGETISPIELNFRPNIPKYSPMDEVPQE